MIAIQFLRHALWFPIKLIRIVIDVLAVIIILVPVIQVIVINLLILLAVVLVRCFLIILLALGLVLTGWPTDHLPTPSAVPSRSGSMLIFNRCFLLVVTHFPGYMSRCGLIMRFDLGTEIGLVTLIVWLAWTGTIFWMELIGGQILLWPVGVLWGHSGWRLRFIRWSVHRSLLLVESLLLLLPVWLLTLIGPYRVIGLPHLQLLCLQLLYLLLLGPIGLLRPPIPDILVTQLRHTLRTYHANISFIKCSLLIILRVKLR